MTHFQLLMDSLTKPKKLANYRALSVGKVLQYTFLLITFVTVFSFGQFMGNVTSNFEHNEEFVNYINNQKWIIYPVGFLVLFVAITSIQFLKISLYALAGWFMLKTMKRRGEYRHTWRTATFAMTWATILTIIFTILQLSDSVGTIIGMFITIGFTMIAIYHYPKLRKP